MRNSVNSRDITEGIIWRQLLSFFFPILFGTFFQQLYNTADTIIVGQFVGKEALAAVGGSTSVLINFLVNLFVGLSSGTTVIVAQYYGAQEYENLSKAVHTSVALSIVAGAGMMVLSLLIAPTALRWMGTPEEIMNGSLTYMCIYLLGTIPSFFYNVGAGVLRAVGDTRHPLYFLIISCLTNIILDLLFVVVFHWEIMGVALATLMSQVVSAVLILIALMQRGQIYQLFPKKIRFTANILRHIIRVGLPAGLQAYMYSISNIILQSCINSFGTTTIAAWTAFGKIDGFFWMIMGAYGISITTFVGQNFGAQKYDRMKKSVRICLAMSLGTSLFMSGLLYIFCFPLYQLFTTDQEVMHLGIEILHCITPFYFTYVCVEILAGAIRGTGDSLVPMILTGFGVCVMRVLWVIFVVPLSYSFSTVIISYPITWAITSILFIIYYLHGGWLRRRIAKVDFSPKKES